jgi:hypothetical protein
MRQLHVLIIPTRHRVAIGATDGERTMLRATLPMPWHAQALPSLLEALGRFHPLPIRAALVVDDARASYATRLYPGWFPDFGGGLYELEIVDRRERGTR